jgi:threonine dehydratase
MVQQFVDDVVLVSEQAIRRAIRLCLACEHIILEGSAAVGIACLIERPIEMSGQTAVILTGRNVDLTLIRDILQH